MILITTFDLRRILRILRKDKFGPFRFDRNSKATLICQQGNNHSTKITCESRINDISSRGYVEVSNLVWLDYSTNIRYLINIDGDAVVLFKSHFCLE